MAASYESSVFLNVPFDDSYAGIFQAVLFTVFDCGFQPRCALEEDDSSEVRIDKLRRMIRECRWGIHDISRTQLDHQRLPRFNMPLELGLFLGAKWFGSDSQPGKACLILDREPYRYQKFCSDVSGQDIRAHHDKPEVAITRVRDWLSAKRRPAGILIPGGPTIVRRYAAFQQQLPAICHGLRQPRRSLPYNDFTWIVSEWLKRNPW